MKRSPLKLGLLILAGAIINFVISCFCFQMGRGCVLPAPDSILKTLSFPAQTPVATPDVWKWIQKFNLTNPPTQPLYLADLLEASGTRTEVYAATPFACWHGPRYAQLQTGWPLLSFVGAIAWDSNMNSQYRGFINANGLHPWTPLWNGFVCNTLLYTVVAWLGWQIAWMMRPILFRKRYRIKRGLCPACAYPVGINPRCTECGKPVKPSA